MNDTAPQEPTPDTVNNIASKPRVLRLNQPIGKHFTRVFSNLQLDGCTIWKNCPLRRSLDRHFFKIKKNNLFLPFCCPLKPNLRKKSCKIGQTIFRPLLRLYPHKCQSHSLCNLLGFFALICTIKIDLGNAKIATTNSKHLPHELVIGHILTDARPNPTVIGLHRIGPEIDGKFRLNPQQVSPLYRPIVDKFLTLKQVVDPFAAFIQILTIEELSRLLRRGQSTDNIQVNPSDKHRV